MSRRTIGIGAVVLAGALLATCGRGSRVAALRAHRDASTAATALSPGSAAPSGTVVHQVSPTATDPAIVGPADPNLAAVGPASGWNGKLAVFLPGSGGKPS
ncbi:MAG: hypothetical protein JO265_08380, partial [Acidimicrobiia bacterium]|nr:hypothetical protein [Acidimicrobiia bacterium]